MTPNPILKVLSTLKKHKVKALLIGGQACIIYGAAEFSRDSDFVILCTRENLERLKKALAALKAGIIYVPPFEARYLERGHACHFRCLSPNVRGLRIDVIAKLRGCDPFDRLWKRRSRISVKGMHIDVIGLRDLVQSKKTQRDKDWLMLKRLVENDIIRHKHNPAKERIKWWVQECRDAQVLIELAKKYPKTAKECIADRPVISAALISDIQTVNSRLHDEELRERQRDIEYWAPLIKELEEIRHKKR